MERDEPSEQPCREGVTLPPVVPPGQLPVRLTIKATADLTITPTVVITTPGGGGLHSSLIFQEAPFDMGITASATCPPIGGSISSIRQGWRLLGLEYVGGTTAGWGLGTLIARPFIVSGHDAVITKIRLEVILSPGSGSCRVAIYNTTSQTNNYPTTRVTVDDILFSTAATGFQEFTLASPLTLPAENLYWAAFQKSGNQFAGQNVRATNSAIQFMATSTANFTGEGWQSTATYGVMPANFPAGATNFSFLGTWPTIAGFFTA